MNIRITATVFAKTASQIEDIVKVCRKNDIELTSSVFLRTAKEIEDIVRVCRENDIEIKGNVFRRTVDEIEKILKICKKYNVELSGSVFMKGPDEIEKIIKVCIKNKLEAKGNIFLKLAKQLEDNIEYIKTEFSDEYVKPLIVSKNLGNLKKVLPYLNEKGYLEYVKESPSILDLTLEQVIDRENFIKQQGETMIDNRGKFNSIFGLTNNRYEKRVANAKAIEVQER